jgi:hypothetical protein
MKSLRLSSLAAPACLAALLCLAPGCGGSEEAATEAYLEKSIEAQGGGEVDVEMGEDGTAYKIKSETEEGTVEFSAGGDVAIPEGFPKDVPLHEAFKASFANATAEQEQFSLQGIVPAPLDEMTKFYTGQAAEQGWKQEQEMTTNGEMSTFIYTKEGRTLSVVLVKEDANTNLTLSVGRQ